jgi:hypothetical protein
MAVDNGTKPKFIKLLKTWDENEIFSPAKIHEIRDTMMLMLQNGGIFPEHLNAGGQGPQVGGQAHMAQGPMDVEASYSAHHAYNNQPGMNMHRQYIGGLPMDIEGHFAARKSPSIGTEEAHRRDHVRGSNSPIIRDSGGPRVMDVKELIRSALVRVLCRRCQRPAPCALHTAPCTLIELQKRNDSHCCPLIA